MILPTLITSFLAGLVLLIRGLRGKRVGESPYCRKCGYNLAGVEGPKCPKCGSIISPRSITVGYRQRRASEIIVGSLLLAFSVPSLVLTGYDHVRDIDWYDHYPFGILFALARGGDMEAFRELVQRNQSGALSAAAISELGEYSLGEQKAGDDEDTLRKWISLLEALDISGQLTQEQQQQYYKQLVTGLSMEVRSPIATGDAVVAQISYGKRTPAWRLQSDLRINGKDPGPTDISIDGRPVPFNLRRVDGTEFGSGPWINKITLDATLMPGQHEVVVGGELVLYRSSQSILLAKPFRFGERFEVVPKGGGEAIVLVDDPEIGHALQNALRVSTASVNASGPDNVVRVYTAVGFKAKKSMPIALSCDVTVRVGSEEYDVGTLTCSQGSTEVDFDGTVFRDTFEETDALVVLRPNPEHAKRSVDIREIWGEELILGPIRVGREVGRQP